MPLLLIAECFIGSVYDIVGRRIPLAGSYVAVSLGLIVFISGHKVYPWFLIARMLGAFEAITGAIPFVPDLIMEESHGVANAMKISCLGLADVFSTSLLGLSGLKLFDDVYIFYFVLVMNTSVAVTIIVGMKDVIKTKEFDQRRKQTNSSDSKIKRAKVVCS